MLIWKKVWKFVEKIMGICRKLCKVLFKSMVVNLESKSNKKINNVKYVEYEY